MEQQSHVVDPKDAKKRFVLIFRVYGIRVISS